MFDSVVRIYKIPPGARGDLQSFLERLSKHIKTPVASITVRGDSIRVELAGPSSQIAESLESIRNLFKEYGVKLSKKVRTITFGQIEDLVGAGIPVDTLEELLKLKGYPTRRKAKKSIETRAPRKVVVEEASKLVKAYEKLKDIKISKSAAKMVSVASAYLDLDPLKVVEEATNMGLIYRDPHGRFGMNYAWRAALREFIRSYRTRMSQSG